MRRLTFETIAIHAVWILAIFLLTDGPKQPILTWLATFNQWDSRWYLAMAMDGHGFLPQTYAFPPLHGWILGRMTDFFFSVASLFGAKFIWLEVFNCVSFGFGVSMFTLGNTIFAAMGASRFGIERRRLLISAAASPVGYFALTAYSDAFFFAIFSVILWFIVATGKNPEAWLKAPLSPERRRSATLWLWSLLFLAPWVRLTGFALAVLGLIRRKETIAVLVSLACFLFYYRLKAGDPLFFLFTQKAFYMADGSGLRGLKTSVEIFASFFTGEAYLGTDYFLYTMDFGLFPLLALTLSVLLTMWLFLKGEREFSFAVAGIVILSHNQGFWRSTFRYAFPFYAMFYWILLARTNSKSTARRTEIIATAIAAISFAIQVFYCRLFRSGGWAF